MANEKLSWVCSAHTVEGVTSGDYRRGVLKKTQGGTKPVTTGICKHLSCAFMEDNN